MLSRPQVLKIGLGVLAEGCPRFTQLVRARRGRLFTDKQRVRRLTIYYTDEPEYLAEALTNPQPLPASPPPKPSPNDGQASER